MNGGAHGTLSVSLVSNTERRSRKKVASAVDMLWHAWTASLVVQGHCAAIGMLIQIDLTTGVHHTVRANSSMISLLYFDFCCLLSFSVTSLLGVVV
jgi:hypothetical protein